MKYKIEIYYGSKIGEEIIKAKSKKEAKALLKLKFAYGCDFLIEKLE